MEEPNMDDVVRFSDDARARGFQDGRTYKIESVRVDGTSGRLLASLESVGKRRKTFRLAWLGDLTVAQ